MDETFIPQDSEFRIQLPTFEGPLDLLLHLIKKHELNILDLPIAFVTERYLDYLQMMQELDLDVASEYLLMAATLAHIKSKMLLPQNPLEEAEEQEGDDYIADPRAELIRRLLEYQKYKAAAEQLGARPLVGRDVFARGIQPQEAQGPAPLAPIDLYKLLDAFGAILKRVKGRAALEVTAERITINERMSQLSELLREKRSCVFEDLFATDRTRYEVVVTFLALLEMTKLRMTRVYQADPKSPIHVQYALLDADESGEGGEGGEASQAAVLPEGSEPFDPGNVPSAESLEVRPERELIEEALLESLEADAVEAVEQLDAIEADAELQESLPAAQLDEALTEATEHALAEVEVDAEVRAEAEADAGADAGAEAEPQSDERDPSTDDESEKPV